MSSKIEVRDLEKHFPVNRDLISQIIFREDLKYVDAVDGVSLDIREGETLGIAGESGCGKSTLGRTILHIYEPDAGQVFYDGVDIASLSSDELLEYRTNMQIIHQDPYQSINPRWRIHKWIREPLDIHNIGTMEEREAKVNNVLERVGLTPVSEVRRQYAPNLSGGQRQRVNIARAIITDPEFIVADEPVSMLDVSIRADILDLLEELREDLNLAMLYISHDLSMLQYVSDRIIIMYLGKIVESGPADEVINNPKHPYTKALVDSMPSVHPDARAADYTISGQIPDPIDVPDRCRLAERCPEVRDECRAKEPELETVAEDHMVRCVLYHDDIQQRPSWLANEEQEEAAPADDD